MLTPSEVTQRYEQFLSKRPDLNRVIKPSLLPYVKFRVFEDWWDIKKRPDVLMIAESPPWDNPDNYFYNPKEWGNLSCSIFDYLDMDVNVPKDVGLRNFAERGYLLVDTIKCIYSKGLRPTIPRSLIRFSAQNVLSREIAELNPRKLLVLGRTALLGLSYVEGYEELRSKFSSVGVACGKDLSLSGRRIILSVFPNDMNRRYAGRIRQAFGKAKDP
jgi:hypothetical protein